jgi:hypothetical protein
VIHADSLPEAIKGGEKQAPAQLRIHPHAPSKGRKIDGRKM